MIRRAALVAAVVFITIIACANAPGDDGLRLAPTTRERMLPIPAWPELDRWWQEVQTCTGRPTPLPPPALFVWADTAFALGLVPLDGLYLADVRVMIVRRYDPQIIRHEMAHDRLAPDTSHPAWVAVACGAILRWP